MAEESSSSCILVSGSTQPTPSSVIASRTVDVLNEARMKDEEIRIVVATGLHRPCTEEELVERLGKGILRRIRVSNHNAYDASYLVYARSKTQGTPVWLNRIVAESDLVVSDGYI